MNNKFSITILLFVLFSISAFGEIKLPRLISDGVVLQRDTEIKIWGWASPREEVVMTFKKKKYKTQADEDGNWSIALKPQKAGGPYEMTFKGQNELKVSNVMFGDVWICTGQSNMVIYMERVKEKYTDEIANVNYPDIRHFFIPTLTNLEGPQDDLPAGEWKSAVPGDIMRFSAIAYFFAKDIYEKYHIPIGLINASVGGTPIQSWISEEGFKEFPKELEIITQNKDTAYINSVTARRSNSNNNKKETDKGLTGALKWFDPAYVPKGWHNINVPGYWEDQGLKDLNGSVWYRKEIEVPESMTGVDANLYMGRVVDADYAYVNGVKVGNITYQYPPRRYVVPAGVLKPGKNSIVMRVINYNGKGGFVPDKPYFLTANGQDIDLKGDWQYKVGDVFKPRPRGSGGRQFSKQNLPTSLYNAMVAPLTTHPAKGFLWYQGESNSENPAPYYDYLPALIHDWRNQWNDDDMPFLYVQLANFMDIDYLPTESNWAELRDAQLHALSVPNTAMTVAMDLGEWNDIHPLNKEDVGKRLALAALNLSYGEDIVYSGPIFKSSQIDGNKIIIDFDFVGGGLVAIDDEPLRRFEIAGYDQKFVRADAEIVGNTVVVHHVEIKYPKYVRYAWANNPDGANLYNKEGLPASAFRTYNPDDLNDKPWQGRKTAVILTYDDALNVHLDNAVPLLDSLGLKGTFYLSSYSAGYRERIKDWKTASKSGHELGNHTLFHPCIGAQPGREWVNPDYDMSTYTLERMVDEVRMNNALLETLDGKKERTFAFTCGDMKIGDEYFMNELKNEFVAARAVRHEMHPIDQIDVYSIDCYSINGESGDELIALAKQAIESNSLLVFLFHGVGGEHSLDVSLSAHRELLQYLKQNEEEIWTATMIDVVENIKINQSK